MSSSPKRPGGRTNDTYTILAFGGNEKQAKTVFPRLEAKVQAKVGRRVKVTTMAPCWRKDDGRSAGRALRVAQACDAVLLLTHVPTNTGKVVRRDLRRLGVPFHSTGQLGIGGLTQAIVSLVDSLDKGAARA